MERFGAAHHDYHGKFVVELDEEGELKGILGKLLLQARVNEYNIQGEVDEEGIGRNEKWFDPEREHYAFQEMPDRKKREGLKTRYREYYYFQPIKDEQLKQEVLKNLLQRKERGHLTIE